MPFVPLDPEEQKTWVKEPCRDAQHSPPNMILIEHPMKWVCPSCGAEFLLFPPKVYVTTPATTEHAQNAMMCAPARRTKAQVMEERSHAVAGGCCNRFADQMGCTCLFDADGCDECNDTGYKVHPQNGWVRGVRCSHGCRVNCSICNDPNCDNPGGQH